MVLWHVAGVWRSAGPVSVDVWQSTVGTLAVLLQCCFFSFGGFYNLQKSNPSFIFFFLITKPNTCYSPLSFCPQKIKKKYHAKGIKKIHLLCFSCRNRTQAFLFFSDQSDVRPNLRDSILSTIMDLFLGSDMNDLPPIAAAQLEALIPFIVHADAQA